jgi:hypothetical protein
LRKARSEQHSRENSISAVLREVKVIAIAWKLTSTNVGGASKMLDGEAVRYNPGNY